MWLLTRISLPHLGHHRARTALTLLGIALGVAAMVATTSVTDSVFQSFRHGVEVTAGRAELQLSNGTAGVPENLADAIADVPGVAAAAPLVEGFVSLADAHGVMLAIFGLDLLGDREHEVQLPRSAVDIPDDVLFLNQADSVALARPFAAARGLVLGDGFDVVGPSGPRRLTVRGLVDPVGATTLFGGVVGLMDVPAAQRLLGKEGRFDRIDVRLAEGADRATVMATLATRVAGRAEVAERAVHGARAEDLLFSVRVMLGIAALVAVVVGFFLIHHTVSVSVLQRRREIVLLNALGVSRRAIVGWLGTEAIALGTVAGFAGYAIGFLLARLSLSSVETVATAFTPLPTPTLSWSPSTMLLALGVGIASTCVATIVPVWSVISVPGARFLHLSPAATPGRPRRALVASVLGMLVTGALVVFAPRTLPYRSLVAFIFTVNSLSLVSCALLSPLAALALGRVTSRAAGHTRGLSLLLAGRSVERNPAGPVAVMTAIVLGLGWTLADASLIESFQRSWLGWVDTYYQSDLIVSAGPATVSFLTAPPVTDTLVDEVRGLPGVQDAHGERIVDVTYRGRATALQAVDPPPQGFPMIAGSWPEIAGRFRSGDGVLVSGQLAHLAPLAAGDVVTVETPAGARSFPVLGVFTDFRVGTMGSIAMARSAYRAAWQDGLVNSIRVWATPGTDVETLRNAIQDRFGRSHGLHAVTAREFRGAVADLTGNIFALHYTVVVIALLVAVVGVTNFLLTSVLDRQAELRTLHASGVPARDIRRAIQTEGVLLGIVGGLIGLVAGAAVARLIVQHSVPMVNGWQFQFYFPVPTAIRLAASVALLAGVAGTFPAYLATRRRPATQEISE